MQILINIKFRNQANEGKEKGDIYAGTIRFTQKTTKFSEWDTLYVVQISEKLVFSISKHAFT